MFALAAVVTFAVALLLDILDVGPDFSWLLLGLLLMACHLAFGWPWRRTP